MPEDEGDISKFAQVFNRSQETLHYESLVGRWLADLVLEWAEEHGNLTSLEQKILLLARQMKGL